MQDWLFEVGPEPYSDFHNQLDVAAPSEILMVSSVTKESDDWLELLSTPTYPGDVFIGTPRLNPGAPSDFYDWEEYDTSGRPQEPNYRWEELTDCVTIIGGFEAPDGATYVVPEGIDADYINKAIKYLHSLLPGQKEFAFKEMYTNRNHPHFLDFKEMYIGIANQTYYSDVLGEERTTSAFEPFGNFLYGFVGVLGGIDPAVLRLAAAVMQEGDNSGGDAPEDVPHVNFGIERALHYLVIPHDVVSISSCGD